jgi:hypothetical protein
MTTKFTPNEAEKRAFKHHAGAMAKLYTEQGDQQHPFGDFTTFDFSDSQALDILQGELERVVRIYFNQHTEKAQRTAYHTIASHIGAIKNLLSHHAQITPDAKPSTQEQQALLELYQQASSVPPIAGHGFENIAKLNPSSPEGFSAIEQEMARLRHLHLNIDPKNGPVLSHDVRNRFLHPLMEELEKLHRLGIEQNGGERPLLTVKKPSLTGRIVKIFGGEKGKSGDQRVER